MEGHDRAALWRDDRWRSARLPATVTGLVLVERVLLDEVGSPAALLRDLGGIGRSWADPVASVLAVVALMAETLVAYLLIVLLLQSLCSLPGSWAGSPAGSCHGSARRWSSACSICSSGRAARPGGLATAPGAPPGHRWDGSELVSTASLAVGGSVGPSTLSGLATTSHAGDGVAGHSRRWDRPERGPLPAGQRRRCRPGWGGGPSNAAPSHGDEAGGTVAPAHSSNPGTSAAPGHRQAPGDPKVAVRLPLRRGARGLSDRFGY